MLSAALQMQLLMQFAGTLDGQCMHGHAIRSQIEHAIQRLRKDRQILSRKRGDEIHVDIFKADFAGEGKGANRVFPGMRAADAAERCIREGLRIDADARHAGIPEHLQHDPIDGIGPTGLHRPFHGPGERLFRAIEDFFQRRARNGGGRASAHIAGPEAHSLFFDHGATQIYFAQKRLHIRFDQMPIADFSRGKGTVQAAGLAKGNADIQIERSFREDAQPALHLFQFHEQRRARGGDIEHVHQRLCGLFGRFSLGHLLIEQTRGTDAGQGSPGRTHSGNFPKQRVQAELDLPLAQALFFHFRAALRRRGKGKGFPPAGKGIFPKAVAQFCAVNDGQDLF